MADNEPQQFEIPCSEEPGAPALFVSSVGGGIGAGGELIVHLYRDEYRTPSRFRSISDASGVQRQEPEFDNDANEYGLHRRRVGELILTPAAALQMAAWLQQASSQVLSVRPPQPNPQGSDTLRPLPPRNR